MAKQGSNDKVLTCEPANTSCFDVHLPADRITTKKSMLYSSAGKQNSHNRNFVMVGKHASGDVADMLAFASL